MQIKRSTDLYFLKGVRVGKKVKLWEANILTSLNSQLLSTLRVVNSGLFRKDSEKKIIINMLLL